VSKHLHREVDKLKKQLLSLSALVEEAVQRAARSVQERDPQLAKWVIDIDFAIDQREVEIEEECLKTLALHQPVAHDLRFIISVLKINGELERIGDATVNIAERAQYLATVERVDVSFDFGRMSEIAQDMLRRSIDALVNLDAGLAYEVIATDDKVDELNREMYELVEDACRQDPEQIRTLTHVLGISRHLERIGDHASNIAEDVIYLVKGEIVRHRSEEYRRV
jgi:phosphate transport system protein